MRRRYGACSESRGRTGNKNACAGVRIPSCIRITGGGKKKSDYRRLKMWKSKELWDRRSRTRSINLTVGMKSEQVDPT